MAISKASAKWTGTLKEGTGSMKGGTGYFDAPFTFLSRFEGVRTGTNPEELIGAANAGCFSMFLAAQLTAAGHAPTRLETNAVVPGLSQSLFDEKVAFSKQNCPITRALGGVPEITIKAKLG